MKQAVRALLAGTLLAAVGLPAAAERVRIEAVGAAAAEPAASARERALEAGVEEAVLRAAAEIAREAGSDRTDPAALATALGGRPQRFAVRFQLLEDRGDRPAQLVQEPGVERERVVVVEADVDREAIQRALRDSGLLGRVPQASGERRLAVRFEGVDSWAAWERLRRALAARAGSARAVEFARGEVVAEVVTDESEQALVERLQRGVGDALALEWVGSDAGGPRLRVIPPAPAVPAPGAPPESAAGAAPGADPGI